MAAAGRRSWMGTAARRSTARERLMAMTRTCSLGAVTLFTAPGIPAAQATMAQVAGAPATAATVAAKDSDKPVSEIVYKDGKLTIRAHNATLSDILGKVSRLTGVPIEAPDGANAEFIPELTLGPGPIRAVLASLLSGAHFDYILQEADDEPDKLQTVLIMPKKGGEGSGAEAAVTFSRGVPATSAPALSEAAVHPPEAPIPSTVIGSSKPQDTAPSEPPNPNAANPTAQVALSDPSANMSQPERDAAGAFISAHPPVPAALNPQSISQQLTQMYQQRMQMTQQQQRPAASSAQ